MEKFLNKYRIDSIRLSNRDYGSAGFYFVTICVKYGLRRFGRIENNKMVLSDLGEIADQNWLNLPNHFSNIVLDEFIIMPNHVHTIIQLSGVPKMNMVTCRDEVLGGMCRDEVLGGMCRDEACLVSTTIKPNRYSQPNITTKPIANPKPKPGISPKPGSLPTIIGSYKSAVTKMINEMDNNFYFLWQPRYYERVIRNKQELNRIRKYIRQNPDKWGRDKNNQGIFM